MSKKLTIEEVNQLEAVDFVDLFENAVELWPNAAESVTLQRPFVNLSQLISRFDEYLDSLGEEEKIAVLKSYPDLAGKLLDDNKLSNESTMEHALAGLDKLTPVKKQQLVQSNREYADKFGFPFIICVRQTNKIDRILEGFKNRLPNTRKQEIFNGIEQVKRICQLRVENLVGM